MTARRLWRAVVLLSLLTQLVWSQARREPLTGGEIDELRDAAQDPETRLKSFVKFARTRLTALDQVRSDPKVTDRAQQTHDKFAGFRRHL